MSPRAALVSLDKNATDLLMTGETTQSGDDRKKLGELAYLCSSVSHHVINSFSSIVSNAEIIRAQCGGTSDRSELEQSGSAIVETALDASKVARKLIDWARRAAAVAGLAEGGELPVVDLDGLIREKLEAEQSLATARVDWLLNLGSVAPIPGDAGALSAMLGYLLQNAREALPDGAGTIEVSTSIDPRNRLVIAIRDTGCGMSPDVLKRATEPFFSTKPDRAGIGLTIAQGIWRRHRGSLSIDSQPGSGATMRLSIGPITNPRPVATAPRAEDPKAS
jgi:two-component system, NtrC family, sensor kinase